MKDTNSTFRIVRAALGYGVIVVIREEDAKYFLYNDNLEGFGKGKEGVVLKEISGDTVWVLVFYQNKHSKAWMKSPYGLKKHRKISRRKSPQRSKKMK
jgi:hypothetical protein